MGIGSKVHIWGRVGSSGVPLALLINHAGGGMQNESVGMCLP